MQAILGESRDVGDDSAGLESNSTNARPKEPLYEFFTAASGLVRHSELCLVFRDSQQMKRASAAQENGGDDGARS